MLIEAMVLSVTLASSAGPDVNEHEFVWSSETLGDRRHRAVEMRPNEWNGWAVVLLGGGMVTDENWTVPGSFVDPGSGETMQFTIDGEDTRDAQVIGKALVEQGYVVWRWSSVHEDDQLHAQDPAMAEGLRFADGVELTNNMVSQFLDRTEGLDGAVLIGHSLGANRAIRAGAMDDRVSGFVFLAGARLTSLPSVPSELSRQAIADQESDANGDGLLSTDELTPQQLARWDVDGDGAVRGWEIAGVEAARAGGWPDGGRGSKLELLIESEKPALALFGGLDTMSVHGPVLAMEAERVDAPIEVEYFADLGHQLSVEKDGLCDDIDSAIVNRIVDWVHDLRSSGD